MSKKITLAAIAAAVLACLMAENRLPRKPLPA